MESLDLSKYPANEAWAQVIRNFQLIRDPLFKCMFPFLALQQTWKGRDFSLKKSDLPQKLINLF